MLTVKDLVVDKPTHMALGLRQILGMLPSLKGRLRGNFHWYVKYTVTYADILSSTPRP